MNVCLLSRYFDFRNAGVGRVSLELMKGLVKRGHSVHTVSTNGTSLYSYFWYTAVGILPKIPRGSDIYHAVTPMEALYTAGGKNSIVTFHDLFQLTNKDKLGSGLGYSKWKNFVGTNYFRFVVSVAKHSRQIVAVSEKTKEDLVERLRMPEKKITVIKSGIRPDLVPLAKRDKVFRVGYLGQLDRRKRVDLLIDAFRKSSLDELRIGGMGVDGSILKERAGGDTRIKFQGLISDNKLVDFYNSLDVLVFPTWLEGYGLPIVEAMACKKPVVVLDDANIPWEVKKRCIIVEGLGYTLGNLAYLRGLCRTADIEGNYEWAREHNWDKTVDEYIKVYEEVLGG